MNTFLKILTPIILLIFTAACGNEENAEDADTIEVYTTVFPLKSFTEQIGGDSVNVHTIYPNGVDIHTYEPTQKDMIDFAESDLFVYTTDEFDSVASNIKNAVDAHTEFLPAADAISHDALIENDHDHDHGDGDDHNHDDHSYEADPHVWLDPVFSQIMAESIKDRLIEINPEEEAMYEENYEVLLADLEEIDEELETVTDDSASDSIYISHESIGYLAERYGFEQRAINGLNNDEPSQRDLTQIVDDIEAHDIEYILYEQNVTSRVTETIQNSTGTEPLEFHNLAVLVDEDAPDATYQSIMRDNVSVIDQALNGQ